MEDIVISWVGWAFGASVGFFGLLYWFINHLKNTKEPEMVDIFFCVFFMFISIMCGPVITGVIVFALCVSLMLSPFIIMSWLIKTFNPYEKKNGA